MGSSYNTIKQLIKSIKPLADKYKKPPGFGTSKDVIKVLNELLDQSSHLRGGKIWPFQTNEAVQYAAGFYDFAAADDNFSPSIFFGNTNVGRAAHLSIITGAATVDEVTIRVTGTSITDGGVQTGSDTEDIVIPTSTAVDSYFETSKKWNGQVSIETIAGTAVTCNYGWSKYHDFANTNFKVVGVEALWESDSTDSSSNISLLHHKATGWTFNPGAEPTPPAAIANRNSDHSGNVTHQVGQGAWKRTNLDINVQGADSEGILFCIDSGNTGVGNLSFRSLSLELEVIGLEPYPPG